MTLGHVETIFRTLNDAGARYLVVGGLAVVAHGYVRLTANLDLVFATDDANLRTAVAGRSVSMELVPGVTIPVIDLDDLIAMKSAVGRPQDLEDVRRLKALQPGTP